MKKALELNDCLSVHDNVWQLFVALGQSQTMIQIHIDLLKVVFI